MRALQQAILPGLQPENPHAHSHRRKALHLPFPRLQQAIQPEIKLARSPADPSPRGRHPEPLLAAPEPADLRQWPVLGPAQCNFWVLLAESQRLDHDKYAVIVQLSAGVRPAY